MTFVTFVASSLLVSKSLSWFCFLLHFLSSRAWTGDNAFDQNFPREARDQLGLGVNALQREVESAVQDQSQHITHLAGSDVGTTAPVSEKPQLTFPVHPPFLSSASQ